MKRDAVYLDVCALSRPFDDQEQEKLVEVGFGIADAAHVAYSEAAGAHFISCDDRLVKQCRKHIMNMWCGNPISFCEKEGIT